MTYKFNCEICKYSTNRLYCYNKHLNTKKHIDNENKNTIPKNGIEIPKNGIGVPKNGIKCCYCNKIIKFKNHLKRHYDTCKEKIIKEKNEVINKLQKIEKEKDDLKLKCKQEKKDLLEQLETVENEYLELLKKIANGEIPSNTTINNNTINMYYIINNYKDAYNYEDLIKKPLTKEEIEYINENGPTAGCYKVIENRCIKDIELAKRPFHCLDDARSKYMLRVNNNWDIDKKADRILTATYPKIRPLFPYEDVDKQTEINNVNKLLDMETKGKHKIINELNKKTLLKKNIKKKLKDKKK